jgi:hypothetical protein
VNYIKDAGNRVWLIAGATAGFAIGAGLYFVALSGSESIAVLQSGRVGGMESVQTKITPQLVVDRRGTPQLLIDLMQTPEFAARVATRAGMPSLALDLAATQYGGRGKLKTRPVSDGSLVEIRVRADNAVDAMKLGTAALSLGIEEDLATMSTLRSVLSDRVKELELEKQRLTALADSMIHLQDDNSAQIEPRALDAAASVVNRLQSTNDNLWAIRTGLSRPMSQDSKVFTEVALTRPIVSSWWKAAVAGLLLGAFSVFSIRLLVARTRETVCDQISTEPHLVDASTKAA